MRLLIALALSLCVAGAQGPESSGAAPEESVLLVIPHTHWEGAVFKTREEYLEIGLPHILEALNLLEKFPGYRFVLDQQAYVKPFLERYPEQSARFRRFVDEGRLQLTGGMVTMMDVNMPGGESFIRHLLYGKRYYRDELGYDTPVGWGLDSFGHHSQLPQLLRLAGFESYWFQRGPRRDAPAYFQWEGIDGTRIPAIWLAQSYANFFQAPANMVEFAAFAGRAYNDLSRFTDAPVRVAMAGADVEPPKAHIPAMVEAFNKLENRPFEIRFAVPTDFVEAMAKRPEPPVYSHELNPIFQGIYSSRIELKQWIRELERLLGSVEAFGSIAAWLGEHFDEAMLAKAWDPVLFNQAHDLASGVMVNKVYDDTIRGFDFSRRVGRDLLDTQLGALTSRIDTSGEGVPVAVFNTLAWERNDFVEVSVGFAQSGVLGLDVIDPSGDRLPVQLTQVERFGDGGIRDAKAAFIAKGVPALGYAVYRIVPRAEPNEDAEAALAGQSRWSSGSSYRDIASMENEHYRLKVDLWTGAIAELIHKPSGWNALAGEANVVAREPDRGDFWEIGGTLNGGRFSPMERKQPLPEADRALFSNENVGGNGAVFEGPVYSEFSVRHPFGTGQFATRIRLYQGVERVEIQTRLTNQEEYVRYRVLFPTSVAGGRSVHEIPFGAIERPADLEFPAQTWVDYGTADRGVALLNRGLPGNNVSSNTLMLSLLRSTQIQAYAFHGGFEPGVSSDTGLQIGKPLTFDYALVPHQGDWKQARIYRAGAELNEPLLVRKLSVHEGTLPARWEMLEVSHDNAVVSALKPGPGQSTILRVYEAAGQQTRRVTVRLKAKIAAVHEANLLEDSGQSVGIERNAFTFDLSPYQIRTFRLRLEQ